MDSRYRGNDEVNDTEGIREGTLAHGLGEFSEFGVAFCKG